MAAGTAESASGAPRLGFTLPGTPAAASKARVAFAKFVEPLPLGADAADGILLAVGEALANAVEHGSPRGQADRVTLLAQWRRGRLEVAVQDEGPGFDPAAVPEPPTVPTAHSQRGRGLFLMRQFAAAVDFEFSHGGTTVRLMQRGE